MCDVTHVTHVTLKCHGGSCLRIINLQIYMCYHGTWPIYIYIYIHTIYTYDLPLISLLKMGFSHSKLFWFSVENLHWDVPEAVTGEPEELSHEAQAKPLR